ncbi:MAG: AraC family transcriptional regulator [Proteobacteria bacterium]|nr:AraC family transcriptional regulator [Pseudomonadota bacterium]
MTGLRPKSRIAFYLERMQAREFDAERVLHGSGLRAERLGDPHCRPHPLQYRRIILNMLELTGDPYLGIDLGHEFRLSDLGILGYALMSSPTLAASREIWDRYDELNERLFTSRNTIAEGRWFSEILDVHRLGDVFRFAVEEFVSQTIELASSMTNRPFPIVELHVTYPQPADISGYVRRFACPLHFAQPRTLVVFDVNRLQDPISLANEDVFKLCARNCELLVAKNREGAALSEEICTYLVNNPGNFPNLEEMAAHLKMGARTLRRRLVEENTSYQQLLDRTRQDLAQQYLQHTTLTPKEIGYLLGYSSVSNFRRAFKSWTGKTLSDARDDGGPVAAEPAAEAAARAPARTEVT